MALTHVCMWSNQSWKRITAHEASKMFPYGASAHSGLFMCELCGQYVSLTNGSVQSRHFRHSAREQNKDCEDRSDILGYSHYFQAEAHDLPIRIKIVNRQKFELELGFIPVPSGLISGDHEITIISGVSSTNRFIYSTSRLAKESVTYLPIGDEPKESYCISVDSQVNGITAYWPERIEGITTGGALFDASSRKKLPYDADVIVGHEYYLVIRENLWGVPSSITIQEICSSTKMWTTWRVYSIVAHEFSEAAAKFFLEHHCRLTDEPITMYPIWPPHVRSPYVVYHDAKELFVYFKGNAEPQIAPIGTIRRIPYSNPKLLVITANDRQQLLSAGRTRVLNYTYFWHKELNNKGTLPSVRVSDFNGNALTGGNSDNLPEKRTIIIVTEVDGAVEIEKAGEILVSYSIKADTELVLDRIEFGQTIRIYQGCDVAWECRYISTKNEKSKVDDESIYNILKHCKGNEIPIDHSFGTVVSRYKSCPRVSQWIYLAIRKGKIPEEAYKFIKNGIGDMTNDV